MACTSRFRTAEINCARRRRVCYSDFRRGYGHRKTQSHGLGVHAITELTYAEKSGPGPWRLYIYDEHDFHSGGKWFRNGNVKHPDEEISKEEAYQNCVATILLKCESAFATAATILSSMRKTARSSTEKTFGKSLALT